MRSLASCAFVFVTIFSSAAPSTADDRTLLPAAQRYVDSNVEETPDFQRHIVPLLGRQGCNGRSCHGSFQGRGGFRLSLFGYDMKFDHEALTKLTGDADETRVNLKEPAKSLMLVKASDAAIHEGGEKLPLKSWEYQLFRQWIAKGCPPAREGQQLLRLEVTPKEILFKNPGETSQLNVVAHWNDGSSEDVTCLCRFRTNSEAIAEIDGDGKVTSLDRGDTHVVAFYENGVYAVPVMLPVHPKVVAKYPQIDSPTEIDALIVDKLRKLGIVPSELCNDADFLRRVSLDVVGTLPTPAEVEAFVADKSSNKRERKIDELLARPEYAAWWATQLCDITGNNPRQMGDTNFREDQARQWYQWLESRLAQNMPYDQIVEGMFLAVSRRPGQSFEDYLKESVSYLRKDEPADYSQHPMMPHFWSRQSFRKPEDRVLGFSYAFLGIRIQCAQCHKHPFDQWTQQDYQEFQKFFTRVNYGFDRDTKETVASLEAKLGVQGKNGTDQRRIISEAARKGELIPFREVYLTGPVANNSAANSKRPTAKDGGKPAAPKQPARLLGGETIDLAVVADPRVAVMDWLRRKDNPFFAKALANRVWAHYFGRGIIDPPDDLNLANPPSNAALLEHLSRGFIDHGFDLKWLHREILTSAAYQRAWRPNATNEGDRNFSRMTPRRLPAEVAFDAVLQATTSSKTLTALHETVEKRAISHASTTGSVNKYAVQVFGKPERVTTCDCERSGEPTLLQSVFLQNDREMLQLIERGGWLAEVSKACNEPLPGSITTSFKPNPKSPPVTEAQLDAFIREAYLRTISRTPTDAEAMRARTYVTKSATKAEGIRDVLWALLNTREFIVNH